MPPQHSGTPLFGVLLLQVRGNSEVERQLCQLNGGLDRESSNVSNTVESCKIREMQQDGCRFEGPGTLEILAA